MRKVLLLRGVIETLSHAIVHVGKHEPTWEFDDGSYRDKAVGQADAILRQALWLNEKELRKCIAKFCKQSDKRLAGQA